MSEDKRYVMSEQDIEVALRYLKYNEPEKATREGAIALLEELQAGLHGMAHHDPEKLLKLKKELDGHKQA
jgi:hypothetical protein